MNDAVAVFFIFWYAIKTQKTELISSIHYFQNKQKIYKFSQITENLFARQKSWKKEVICNQQNYGI